MNKWHLVINTMITTESTDLLHNLRILAMCLQEFENWLDNRLKKCVPRLPFANISS